MGLLLSSSIFSTIGSILIAVLVLLLTITVHEFGHYIVGKLFKFKINEFSIGMGPAIFKHTKKDGEIFAIRAFPLGGYCAFEGEDEDDENRKNTAETGEVKEKKPLSKDAFNNKKPWQRILVLLAGATFNFVTAILVVMLTFTFYGEFGVAITNVIDDSTYQEYSIKNGDTIVQIDDQFVYMTTDLCKYMDGKKKGDIVKVQVQRDGERQDIYVKLRQDITVSSLTDYYSVFDAFGTLTNVYLYTDDSLITNERFLLGVGGSSYNDSTKVYTLQDLFDVIKTYNDGDSLTLWMTDDLQSEPIEKVVTIPTGFTAIDKNGENARRDTLNLLGISSASYHYSIQSTTIKMNVFESFYRSFGYSFRTVSLTFESIGELFAGKQEISSLSGPIGTISITSKYVQLGFQYFLNIVALIGLSIAIFNVLPLPALDGARAVFVLIEWIRGKPVNRKIEGIVHTVGLILLLIFAVFVDVIKIF